MVLFFESLFPPSPPVQTEPGHDGRIYVVMCHTVPPVNSSHLCFLCYLLFNLSPDCNQEIRHDTVGEFSMPSESP